MADFSDAEVPSIKPHVLIVEPDVVLLHMLARVFEHSGYQTSKATTATEGQVIIRHGKIDVVVIECLLPDRHRVDLPACAAKRSLPVILMSNGPRNSVTSRDKSHPFLAKPFHVSKLLKVVANILVSTAT